MQYIDTQKTLADFNDNERQEIEDFEALKSKTGWRLKQAKIWMILDYPGSSKLALVRTYMLGYLGSLKLVLVRILDHPGLVKTRARTYLSASRQTVYRSGMTHRIQQ